MRRHADSLSNAWRQCYPDRHDGASPVPEPAISGILAAFDRYEVVGLPAAHGLKDLDDLILILVRNPAFWNKVNDIEIECGNSLYQDLLDRYTSGGDVPFREVEKVWRNTTQPACGLFGFDEQLSDLGTFDGDFAAWPNPGLARIKGTSMGKLGLSKFLPPPYSLDQHCNLHTEFTGPLAKPVEELFDAVLYLGAQDLRLWEKVPADIVLDTDYMKERQRRAALRGSPVPAVPDSEALARQIFERAQDPIFKIYAPPLSAAAIAQAVQDCRERKRQPIENARKIPRLP